MGKMNSGESPYYEFATLTKCAEIAKSARIDKAFVNVGDKWFTPDEFLEYAKSKAVEVREYKKYTRIEEALIKIRDPRDNVLARMDAKIKAMQQKRDEFAKRINDYYS